MRKRQLSRLLTTLVLVATMGFLLCSEALAASQLSASQSTLTQWLATKAPAKPGTTPMSGEPDTPGGNLPPKEGPYATGKSSLADWTLRLHWSLRSLLLQKPRFP